MEQNQALNNKAASAQLGCASSSTNRISMYEDEQFNANSFRAMFRPKKSLGFIMPARAKSDHPNRAITLEVLCRPVFLGRQLFVPPLLCDLICHIEHTGIDCPLLYHRPSDLTSRPNYSSMFETLLDSGPHSFDCRSASLLARKMLKAVEKPFIDQESQTQLSKAIDGWDRGAVQNLVNTVKSIISKSPMSRYYRDTLALVCVHLSHVHLSSQSEKTDISHLVEAFTTVLRIKDRILKFLITNAEAIFDPIDFKQMRRKSSNDNDDSDEIIDIGFLEAELQRKESLLTMLIAEVNRESDKDKEEMLWTMQREITQIKRKLKRAARLNKPVPQEEEAVAECSDSHEKSPSPLKAEVVQSVETDFVPPKASDSKSIMLGRQMLSTLKLLRNDICQELDAIRELERKVDVRHESHHNIPVDNPEEFSSKLAQIVIENDSLQAQIEAVKDQIDREQKVIDQCSAELEWLRKRSEQSNKYSPVEVE